MNQHPHITVTDELLVRFLAGEAGPEEAMAVGQWLETPANAAAFEKLQQAWDTAGPGRPYAAPDVAAEWEQFRRSHDQPVKMRRLWPRWAAAAIVIVLAGSTWFLVRNLSSANNQFATFESGRQPQSFTLPDGSLATLQPGAKAVFVDGRHVELSGSAEFEARSDPENPFSVHAGPLMIKVVGTVFNVQQYSDSITVSVSEGAVLAIGESDSMLLKAGMKGNYLLREARFSGTPIPAAGLKPSKTVFEFNDTPLGEAAQRLTAAYGIPVVLDNPALANCRINTTFTDKPLDYVLTVITESLRLEYRKANDTVYIYGNACE